ncbi:hypothetical protein AnigIFM56816_009214 [Aspergillus niger]|nr:hypothetical protein AnigIFM56816_009214 [Aspergillus niger]
MPLQGKDAHGLSSQLKSLGSSATVSQGPKGKAVGRFLADHSARLTWKNCVSLGSADSGDNEDIASITSTASSVVLAWARKK